uniref:Uncharacterized protein n=1 Tax=Chromera velia CCMP2878 TaxID=1169474 RepID=A0A0G4HZ51_9ALVE|eukprot:Cvel_9650.t1-p1 / transcript=Cvel_9650.t1 / gene=Cvel_9650 / organism=Chromera_velia_CCMP2878 / gene_product=hypothetical protein / transcript_product=hypothetical protein / location=Cvel_scaffold561:66357-66866(+) / protein_length=170 / sequence_SO=supercontig / SO=protein_coding / is_pseudo=false
MFRNQEVSQHAITYFLHNIPADFDPDFCLNGDPSLKSGALIVTPQIVHELIAKRVTVLTDPRTTERRVPMWGIAPHMLAKPAVILALLPVVRFQDCDPLETLLLMRTHQRQAINNPVYSPTSDLENREKGSDNESSLPALEESAGEEEEEQGDGDVEMEEGDRDVEMEEG